MENKTLKIEVGTEMLDAVALAKKIKGFADVFKWNLQGFHPISLWITITTELGNDEIKAKIGDYDTRIFDGMPYEAVECYKVLEDEE